MAGSELTTAVSTTEEVVSHTHCCWMRKEIIDASVAHLLGEDLYNHLIEYLKEHLRDVYKKSTDHADEALLTFYIKEWNRYTPLANTTTTCSGT